MTDDPHAVPERSSQDVEVGGLRWRFVVYDDDSYTLVSPDGAHHVPTDHLTKAQADGYLQAGGSTHRLLEAT